MPESFKTRLARWGFNLFPACCSTGARFTVSSDETDLIRRELERHPSADRTYHVDLVDAAGVVHASFEKVLYIRKADASS